MKEIREEVKREVADTHIYYVAIDGTRFTDSEECRKYEESARGVLRGRLKQLTIEETDEWSLLKGCDDNKVIALKLAAMEDIETVINAFLLDNSYYLNKTQQYEKHLESYRALAEQAYKENDILLMGENCEGELYFIDTVKNIHNRLDSLGKEKDNA